VHFNYELSISTNQILNYYEKLLRLILAAVVALTTLAAQAQLKFCDTEVTAGVTYTKSDFPQIKSGSFMLSSDASLIKIDNLVMEHDGYFFYLNGSNDITVRFIGECSFKRTGWASAEFIFNTSETAEARNITITGGKKTSNPKAPKKKKSNKTVDNRKQSDLIKTSGSSQSSSSAPSGKYARYGAKRGIVKRIDDGGDLRVYHTTWWDDYGRLERSEITRTEEKQGKKWVVVDGYQIINIIIDDKHYMYTKSLGWKQLKNTETNFLGSGAKTVDGCKLTKSGTANVNGKQCDVFKGKKSNSTVEYYIWEGIVMKIVEKDSYGTSSTTVESIELPASIDASKFTVPKTASKKK
jgi:hypothetical protein